MLNDKASILMIFQHNLEYNIIKINFAIKALANIFN